MDKRRVFITSLFKSIFSGDFGKRRAISDRLDENDADEIDAMIFGLHTLAGELNEITISRGHFEGMFDAVSEMMVVASKKGLIENVNQATCMQLGYEKSALLGKPVGFFTGKLSPSLFGTVRKQMYAVGSAACHSEHIGNWRLIKSDGYHIPVEVRMTMIGSKQNKKPDKILLTAVDITERLEQEKTILRAMVGAIEQDRMRLASDLHDSMGQQLSAAKFLVSAVAKTCGDEKQAEKLLMASEALGRILAEARDICFNLMPRSLQDFGFLEAVRELCNHVLQSGGIRVQIRTSGELPVMTKALEIDLFRVVQEFIANSVRHGGADHLLFRFRFETGEVYLRLMDNGSGFDPGMVKGTGMGLRNMQSRVSSHDGAFVLKSTPGKGTSLHIKIPIK